MGYGPFRALASSIIRGAHGVAATLLTPSDNGSVPFTLIWASPDQTDEPGALAIRGHEQRRIGVINLPNTIPRGAVIEAPELEGGTIRRWIVDGPEHREGDHARVMLRPEPEPR